MNPYKKLHDLLAALDDKRLVRLHLWSAEDGCGCAIGMILPDDVRKSHLSAVREYTGYYGWTIPVMAKHLEPLGFTPTFVWDIQTVNDDYNCMTEDPEERYARVMKYLKEKSDEEGQ